MSDPTTDPDSQVDEPEEHDEIPSAEPYRPVPDWVPPRIPDFEEGDADDDQ